MEIPLPLKDLGFNHRALTFADFETFCARENIFVLRCAMRSRGMFFIERRPVIALNNKLTRLTLAFVAWHEAVHYLFHPPEMRFFTAGTRSKIEREANDIALCCVLPRATFELITRYGELHNYPVKYLERRADVLARRGI